MRIGDIIICLPIAKYYKDQGYDIVWPININYYEMFKNTIDYVEFLPVPPNESTIYKDSLNAVRHVNNIIDLFFGYYGTDRNSSIFYKQETPFDQFKYKLANVDIKEKFNLKINRNLEDEQDTFSRVIKKDKYIVCHTKTTRGSDIINFSDDLTQYQIVDIDNRLDGITGVFSWITILEKASKIVLSNSSFLNLVNQLNINEPNRMYLKNTPANSYQIEQPLLQGKWDII